MKWSNDWLVWHSIEAHTAKSEDHVLSFSTNSEYITNILFYRGHCYVLTVVETRHLGAGVVIKTE